MTTENAGIRENLISINQKEMGRAPGRGSIMWDTITDLASAPLLFPIATMQSATPAVGTAVNKYAIYKNDPVNRGRRTNWSLMRFLWDGGDVAQKEAFDLRKLHANIKGTLPDGTPYFALHPVAFRIVPDTFLDGVIRIRKDLGKPLDAQGEAKVYEEYVQLCLMFGIPRKYIPENIEAFRIEYDDIIHNTMTYNETVDFLMNDGLKYPPRFKRFKFLQPYMDNFHKKYIYPTMFISARGSLHPTYRKLHNIEWTEQNQQDFEKLCLRMQKFAKWVPRFMRYNPVAYLVMLGFHGPDLVTFEELTRIEEKLKAKQLAKQLQKQAS